MEFYDETDVRMDGYVKGVLIIQPESALPDAWEDAYESQDEVDSDDLTIGRLSPASESIWEATGTGTSYTAIGGLLDEEVDKSDEVATSDQHSSTEWSTAQQVEVQLAFPGVGIVPDRWKIRFFAHGEKRPVAEIESSDIERSDIEAGVEYRRVDRDDEEWCEWLASAGAPGVAEQSSHQSSLCCISFVSDPETANFTWSYNSLATAEIEKAVHDLKKQRARVHFLTHGVDLGAVQACLMPARA